MIFRPYDPKPVRSKITGQQINCRLHSGIHVSSAETFISLTVMRALGSHGIFVLIKCKSEIVYNEMERRLILHGSQVVYSVCLSVKSAILLLTSDSESH